MTETRNQLITYLGYAKLEPSSNEDLAWIVFPLNESAKFTIGTSPDCNLFLPPSEGYVPDAVLYVDEKGKICIENTSQPWTCESLKVGGSVLPANEKCNLANKTTVNFGPYEYTFDFTDPPTVRYLRSLFNAVQCGLCLKLLDEPRSMSCSHVFCQQCLNKEVDKVLAHINNPEELAIHPSIQCPTCSKRIPIQEVTEAATGNFKALTELTKTLRQLNAQRAMCQMCSNKRCMMHGSDYTYCETCRVVLCPICAMDGHRKHVLRSNYVKALRSGQEFARKCTDVKQQWADIMRNVEATENKVQNALKAIDKCTEKLSGFELDINEKMKPSTQLYLEMEKFRTLRWSDKVDVKRKELLDSFEQTMKINSRSIDNCITSLKATATALINTKSPPGHSASLSVGTLTPLSSAVSPHSSPKSYTASVSEIDNDEPSLNSASSPESSTETFSTNPSDTSSSS